jgi:hypothetical protein
MKTSIYEATAGQKQMAVIGRAMCDMSEYANCKGMKEEGFKPRRFYAYQGRQHVWS